MNSEDAPKAVQDPQIPPLPVARPLVPVTLAFMAGIAAPAWGLSLPALAVGAALLLLGATLAWLWWTRRRAFLVPLLFFGLLGTAFYQQAREPVFPVVHLSRLPQGQELILLGQLDRPAKQSADRVQLFLAAEAWKSPHGWRPAAGKLLVRGPLQESPPVGTRLVVRGRLRSPGALKNPGTFDYPRYLAADRIFQVMQVRDPHRLLFLASTEAYPLGEKLRGGIRSLLRDLDPACRAIYLAMLLGDQGKITPEMRRAFARTGTSHLLVINGLHLGMVAAVTYFLVFWLLRRSAWLLLRINVMQVATLVAALPVVGYAWMAGGSPSTQRAEVMVLAFLLLVFLGRPRELWSALALAALVILSLSPLRLFAISFQLSFVAVAALIYTVPLLVMGWALKEADRTPGYGARLLFRGKEWLAVSVVATLGTAPLVAAYFQVVSLLGILVNVVAIPLVLGLALPLGEAAVLVQALSLTPLAKMLLALGQWPLWLGYQAVVWGARVPGSAITVPTPTWLQIGAYYVCLALLFAPRRTTLTWGGALLAGCLVLAPVVATAVRPPGVMEITCLDSYGGLHGVVVTPEDRRLVVSAPGPARWPARTGGGSGPLPGYCHWRQFRRLDLVAALSLSQDNAGEILALVQQFRVGGVWYGERGRPGPAYWDLWNFLGDRGAAPRSLERGRPPASLGSVRLNFIPWTGAQGVALEVGCQGRQALILPPVRQWPAGEMGSVGKVPPDVLVLPAELWNRNRQAIRSQWQPGQVVVYGGAGFPQAAALPGNPCLATRDGAVSVYLSSEGISVRQWRP